MSDEAKETINAWLAKLIANGCCPGLEMVDEEQRIFHIPWRNEKSGGLQDGGNDTIFLRLWAEHKNYTITDGGKEERRDWKHKFRCALNKCSHHITKLKNGKEFMTCQFRDPETTPSSRKRRPEATPPTEREEEHNCNTGILRPSLHTETNGRAFSSDSDSPTESMQRSPNQETVVQNSCPRREAQSVQEIDDCRVAIEVFYGSPHRTVRRWLVSGSNPRCVICSDVCKIQALKETLKETEDVIELNLPPVEDFPDIIGESREMIREILGKMQRGLTFSYESENIHVERRAMINLFVYDGTSHKLTRRRSRHDEPVVFKLFDFEAFHFSLVRHVENTSEPCPETNVFLTIGFEAFPNQVDPFLTVPIYVKVTHMQAEKYKSMMLSRYDSVPYSIMVSGFDSLTLEDQHDVAQGQVIGLQGTPQHPQQSAGNNGINNKDFLVAVKVFYGIPYFQVARVLLDGDRPMCTILYKSEGFVCEGLKYELPRSTESKHNEKINTILEHLTGGVVIKYESGNIFIERRCLIKVFLTDGVLKSTPLPLNKGQEPAMAEAFNYGQFSNQLLAHINDGSKPRPKAEFTLSVGHDIIPNDSEPMRKVLMYVEVTHVKAANDLHAYDKLKNNNQSSEPKISMPDSIDNIIDFINEISVGQPIGRP
ncbi:unnamed protein product [Lymnaea stagnalis]|uniref:IRF tryptophan pentad repeat domain-containing protein n=1 Tax=Lymnaea stagnalis TaxID=6523 RepID=A0AAV2I0I6_LYMST